MTERVGGIRATPRPCPGKAEAAYLAAWSALPRSGPHVEFIDRWSSEQFASCVASLLELAERYPHEVAREHFNLVLPHERDFRTIPASRGAGLPTPAAGPAAVPSFSSSSACGRPLL